MKAYEIKRNTKVRVLTSSPKVTKNDIITIIGVDGMYCNCLDKNNNRIYIASWTKVQPL